MLHKITNFQTPHYSDLNPRKIFWILLVIAVFIRFPFFFRDYIDRDESTFILMGQSWVDGNLPFTQLWDLKPPITFLFFALIISVFGKSLIAIRLIGCIVVAVTALFTYKIGALITSKKIAFWASVGCVLLQSMFGSLQGVMSEHISIAFFMPALYILITKKNIFWYCIAGSLMGLALMTKLNLAYPILVLGLYLLYDSYKKKLTQEILNSLALGFGIIMVIVLTFLPYHLQDISDIWWNSVIRASLEYADTNVTSLLKTLPTSFVFLTFLWWVWKNKYLEFKSLPEQILLLAFVGILFSFIKAGKINGHYMIQIHPVSVIFIGIAIRKIVWLQRIKYAPYALIILILLPAESYVEYFNIIRNKRQKGTYYNGEGITVPQFIRNNNIDTKNILFMEYHIGYWMLDVTPPTKSATHPSNICRDELFPFYDNPRKTAIEEIEFILDELQPQTIVIRKNRSIFDKKLVEENEFINTYLTKKYDTLTTVDGALIYQRLK